MNTNIKPRKQIKIYKDLDFNSLEEYFNYIIDSLHNGQPAQVYNLHSKLNKYNKRQFMKYCMDNKEYIPYNRIIAITSSYNESF